MCFFVGNDFLPHLPSLEIRENAIDRLVKLYKEMVYQTGGCIFKNIFFFKIKYKILSWLTQDGEVNIERVKIIMTRLGEVEDEIFKQRQVYSIFIIVEIRYLCCLVPFFFEMFSKYFLLIHCALLFLGLNIFRFFFEKCKNQWPSLWFAITDPNYTST